MTRRKFPREPKWITPEILAILHAQQIERFGGLHGVLDKNVVLSAVARPINKWSYEDSTDIADLAAAYLVAFAGSQGFNDGNKRTGLACALLFLELNGCSINASSEELIELTLAVATNQKTINEVATWLRARIN